jgi:dolichyl-phosphate beta-glucosyltransferase
MMRRSGRSSTSVRAWQSGYAPDAAGSGPLAVADRGGSDEPARVAPPHTTVCVILPVYNEHRLIRQTVAAVKAFAAASPDYSFLFVDDGSSDDTVALIQEALRSDNADGRVSLLSYARNRGKGYAIRAGVAMADAEMVCFTDGDLAYSLDHLPELALALRTHDVVIGSRGLVHRDDKNTSLPRRVLGWMFNKLARVILNLPHRDTQAGLKGFRADAARRIFARQRLLGFAFDVELVFLARRFGFSVGEIPARVSEEHSDKTSKVNMLRDPLRMFLALLEIRYSELRGRYE